MFLGSDDRHFLRVFKCLEQVSSLQYTESFDF